MVHTTRWAGECSLTSKGGVSGEGFRHMSASVLYMSMSLDGFIAGPHDTPDNPGGDDFIRLHEWYGFASDAGPTQETADASGMGRHFLDEIKETGAVVSGRNPSSRSTTGAATTMTVSRSSCRLTGHRGRRWQSIRW
jgi:hypothetical protein